jgi:hypothetical protein
MSIPYSDLVDRIKVTQECDNSLDGIRKEAQGVSGRYFMRGGVIYTK